MIVVIDGGEIIFVVEDDDMVWVYIESELRVLGYSVIVVFNGVVVLDVLW